MKMKCKINCNCGFGSMDRIYLEGWMLSNGIGYKLDRDGKFVANLTHDQVKELRKEGWPVRVLR